MIDAQPEWRVAPAPLPYPEAVGAMEERVAAIRDGRARELVWLLEHPPLYTAGTSATDADLLEPTRFPVFPSGRGGRHTYHGPGQRIAYVMLDLEHRGRDVRRYVHALEAWVVAALARFGVPAFALAGATGVWTETGAGPAKIAAIGVRVRRWVTFHGIALNVAPDLAHFSGIRPCGLDAPVTSLRALGQDAGLPEVDAALRGSFATLLAPLAPVSTTGPKSLVDAFTPPIDVP